MIKIGVIGAGGNTISAHIPKLIEQKDVEVIAVANRSIASGAKVAKKNGLTIIKPYDALETIFGQGTVALEAIKQTPNVFDVALICAGGGGLTAGCSIIFKHDNPNIQIFTTEPQEWNDQEQSYASGTIQATSANGSGLCDGLLTSEPGKIPFNINLALGIRGLSCEEQYIFEAMHLANEVFAYELEPSGAIALASLIKHKNVSFMFNFSFFTLFLVSKCNK